MGSLSVLSTDTTPLIQSANPAMDSLFQFLNTALAILFVLLKILYYVLVWPRTTKSSSNGKRTAPEAAGVWPLIGHLPSLAGKELPHITLGTMADKYRPIFTAKLGVHRSSSVN
ncbi:hypothetical protein HHK36_015057 [Tetracentron sinense]|uniref:Cytochrome P450 n=1 Tax=Tetracentron sinense TaxID=13715 RepID=A0A834Z472_TETSI|nr:hypothetical protein HHK36_015057 [Tetracentron sinense]